MTATTNEIDAAIEQVVKTGSDPEALVEAVRELAGALGYDLEAKQPDPAAMLVHAKFGGHHEQHAGRDEYVTPCGTVGATNLTSLWNFISCDGCVKALIDGPEPQPRHGEHGTCAVCGNEIRHYGLRDGGRWMHEQPRLHTVPVSFADACEFVAAWHRHHNPPVGHKFSLGVATEDEVLRGVAIVGRPLARHFDNGRTLEVLRAATDGTPNVNSKLYGEAWNVAKSLGYLRLITYTQAGESGASLRGAGYRVVAERAARPGWNMPSRPRMPKGNEGIQRFLWEVLAS
jgi:hypothetical protein